MAEAPTLWQRFPAALRRRPAISAAAVFIGGIALHANLPHGPILFLIAAVVFACSAIRLPKARNALVAFAIFCCAVAAAQIEAFYFSLDDIAAYASDQPHLAKLELELDQPLRTLNTNPAPGGRPLPPRQITTARVVRVLTHSGWRNASGQILVAIDPPNDRLAIGQRVCVLGMLQRPAPALNPGEFDWAAYYRQQRILASIQVPHSDAIQIIGSHRLSPLQWLRESARRTLGAGFGAEHSLDRAVLSALVLGDADPEAADVRDQFRQTGTSYLLAVSGLHIVVVGWLIYALARALLIRPRWTVSIGMAAMLLYGLIALPTVTGVRSIIVMLAVGIALLLRRSVDRVQLLLLAAWMILIIHPLDFFSPGFQVGFVTVAGLILLTERLFIFLGGQPTPDERAVLSSGPRVQQRPDMRLALWFHARRIALHWFCPGIVAWAISMPLMAFYFDQLNPWALIAGPILLPFMFLALAGGLIKLVLTAILPWGANWWAAGARLPIACLRHLVDALAHLPGSHVALPARSLLLVVLYYALLLLPFIPFPKPRMRLALRLGPIAALLLFIALPLTGGAVGPGDGSLHVTLLAVGAGQCAVVELPNGRVMLLDAGSSTLTEPVQKCIAPFLASRGYTSVDEIWLSHGDFDHISGAAEMIRSFGVQRVVVSTEFEDRAAGLPDEVLLDTIRQRHVRLDHFHRGEHANLSKDVGIDILWPPENTSLSSNNAGLVLKLTYARRTILFPADIQQLPENALLGHPDQLHCDVLIAPHHGSSETTTPAFIAAADPLYIVSSNDRTLSQKQRQFEREIGSRALFRTNRCGAVTITIDRNGGLVVTPYLPQPESAIATPR